MTELKKCPFCNGEAEIKNNHIECPECIKNFNSIKSKEQLVNFWNTRKSLTLDEIRAVVQHKYCMNCISFIENENCEVCDIDVVELMQEFEKKAEA